MSCTMVVLADPRNASLALRTERPTALVVVPTTAQTEWHSIDDEPAFDGIIREKFVAPAQPYPDGFAAFARTVRHGFLVLDRQRMPLTWFEQPHEANAANRNIDDALIVIDCRDDSLIGIKGVMRQPSSATLLLPWRVR